MCSVMDTCLLFTMTPSDVSRNSEISLQSYLRKEEPKRGADDDMGNDLFLGGIKFTPDFDNMATQDQWYDLNGGTGRILVGVSFQPSSVSPFMRVYSSFMRTLIIGPPTRHR